LYFEGQTIVICFRNAYVNYVTKICKIVLSFAY